MSNLLIFITILPVVTFSASSDLKETTHKQEESLATPFFSSRSFPIFEKEIIIAYSNPNTNSQTEIYISRSPDTGFALAEVALPGVQVYEDTSRLPRTTYYFKLRAIRGDLKSAYSQVKSFTTGSKFYAPLLTADAAGPGVIELRLYDRSYNDLRYVLIREAPGPDAAYTITAPDSGQIFTIRDTLLEPYTQYHYRVDAYTMGPNMPRYINIVSDTANVAGTVRLWLCSH